MTILPPAQLQELSQDIAAQVREGLVAEIAAKIVIELRQQKAPIAALNSQSPTTSNSKK